MAQERINYYGKIRPSNIDDLSVQRVQAVAGVIQDVADIGLSLASQKVERDATQAAEKAAQTALETEEAPTPQDRAFSAINVYDQTYNETLKRAYLAGAETRIREKINTLATSFPDNYSDFTTAAESLRKGVLEGLPEQYRPAMALQMDAQIAQGRSQVLTAQKTRNLREADEQLALASVDANSQAVESAANGDMVGALSIVEKVIQYNDDRAQAGAITPAQAEINNRASIYNVRVASAQGALKTILDSDQPGSSVAGIRYLSSFKQSELAQQMTSQERDAAYTALQTDLRNRLALQNSLDEISAEQTEIRQKANERNLAISIFQGDDPTGIPFRIANAYRVGDITQPMYDRLMSTLNTSGVGVDVPNVELAIQATMQENPQLAREMALSAAAAGTLTGSTALGLFTGAENLMSQEFSDQVRIFGTELQDLFGEVDPLTKRRFYQSFEVQKRAAAAYRTYLLRTGNGENPAVVFKEISTTAVAQVYEGVPPSNTSTKSNAEKAFEAANKAITEQYELEQNRLGRPLTDEDFDKIDTNNEIVKKQLKIRAAAEKAIERFNIFAEAEKQALNQAAGTGQAPAYKNPTE
jgi:hypothetical protein